MMDRLDRKILRILQEDSTLAVADLAKKVGLSTTPCWKRIKDMEAAGVITGYSALVDRARVGLGLLVVAEVNLGQHSHDTVQAFERAVQASPPIVRCLSTTGQADYILSVLVPDIAAYEQFLHAELFRLPGVTHVRSSIVLKEVKAEVRLPVPAQPPAQAPAPRPRRRARAITPTDTPDIGNV